MRCLIKGCECSKFEPNLWVTTRCSNCMHSNVQHQNVPPATDNNALLQIQQDLGSFSMGIRKSKPIMIRQQTAPSQLPDAKVTPIRTRIARSRQRSNFETPPVQLPEGEKLPNLQLQEPEPQAFTDPVNISSNSITLNVSSSSIPILDVSFAEEEMNASSNARSFETTPRQVYLMNSYLKIMISLLWNIRNYIHL